MKQIDSYNMSVESIEKRIEEFENKNSLNKVITKKSSNLSIVYNIVADLSAGIITAFILNKIYTNFFGKNNLVFAVLLLFCSIAGLYNTMKFFLKKMK